MRIGDDLEDLHATAALRADRHVDGEDSRQEVCPAEPAWRRRHLAETFGETYLEEQRELGRGERLRRGRDDPSAEAMTTREDHRVRRYGAIAARIHYVLKIVPTIDPIRPNFWEISLPPVGLEVLAACASAGRFLSRHRTNRTNHRTTGSQATYSGCWAVVRVARDRVVFDLGAPAPTPQECELSRVRRRLLQPWCAMRKLSPATSITSALTGWRSSTTRRGYRGRLKIRVIPPLEGV